MTARPEPPSRRGASGLAAAALLLSLLLAGGRGAGAVGGAAPPGGLPGEGWPTYRGGSAMAGVSASPIPPRLSPRWSVRLRKPVSAPPVAGGGRFYVVDEGGTVTALRPDGSTAWSRSLAASPPRGGRGRGKGAPSLPFRLPPACAGGIVAVAGPDGTLHALDGADGAPRWKRRIAGGLAAPPSPAEGHGGPFLVAVARRDGALHALELASGKELWRSAPTNRCDGPATAAGGRVVYGNCDAALHVFRSPGGAREGSVATGTEGEVAGSVPFDGATAYVGDRSGRLHAVDAKARRARWVFRGARGAVADGIAVTGGKVLFAVEGGTVVALDRRDGRELWRADAGGRPKGPVAGGDVAVVAADGDLVLFALADGKALQRIPAGDDVTSPALAYGLVVAGTDRGTVEAFGAAAPGAGGGP